MATQAGIDLVTGGAGFIGSHLVDRLVARGRAVRVLDNFAVGRPSNLKQHDGNPRLAIISGDVADAAASAAAEGIERVFHLAARGDIVLVSFSWPRRGRERGDCQSPMSFSGVD